MTRCAATQTDWSWLKDLEELARLGREHGVELSLRLNEIDEMLKNDSPCEAALHDGMNDS